MKWLQTSLLLMALGASPARAQTADEARPIRLQRPIPTSAPAERSHPPATAVRASSGALDGVLAARFHVTASPSGPPTPPPVPPEPEIAPSRHVVTTLPRPAAPAVEEKAASGIPLSRVDDFLVKEFKLLFAPSAAAAKESGVRKASREVTEPDVELPKLPSLPSPEAIAERQDDSILPPDTASAGGAPGYGRFYARGEALLWWTRGYRLPPLVTTAPGDAPEITRGALGAPGTQLLYGDSTTTAGPRAGGRFTFGYNCDPCGICAFEGSYFFLGSKTDGFFNNSAPVLARPFTDASLGNNSRQLVSTPGTQPGDVFALRGAASVDNFSDLYGFEANFRKLLCADCNRVVTGLIGFRALDLREGTVIQEDVLSLRGIQETPVFDPGNRILVTDSFGTHNRFYGGQLGVAGEWHRSRWTLYGTLKVALGVTHQTIDINGSQQVTLPNGSQQNFTGGLLALPSNIGHHTRNQFSVVPELGLRVGYDVTNNVRVFVGYDVFYWTNVVRPGDQIDLTLNVNQIPNSGANGAGPPPVINRPVVPFRSTDFWAQGFNAGLEWHY